MRHKLSRRTFLNKVGVGGSLTLGAAGLAVAPTAPGSLAPASDWISTRALSNQAAAGAAPAIGNPNLDVTQIETTWVNVPFRPVPGSRMFAENYEWTYFEIHKVTLACGVVGFGETMTYYTWGRPTEKTIAYARGRNAAELMWDDALGAGLQMALFDAVGKANDVPLHRLLGPKHRDRAFIS